MSAPRFDPQALLGRTIAGRYALREVQGSGAYGTVYRAEQLFCRQVVRPVAVKVSHQADLTDDTAPALFGDALILARLLADTEHEGRRHLVPIYEMGLLPEVGDRAFLVMEYVAGRPLLAHMRAAGRFGVAAGLRAIKEICRALALVHSQGAVHRDLAPDNVLVDRRGVIRLVDFGLAAFTDARSGFAPGSLGRFAYMAPETLEGRSTPASDIYALGLLMYELFTAGGPHLNTPWPSSENGDHRTEHQRLKAKLRFPPPSTVQNEIRNDYRWLDTLILRCLELEPSRRYSDAGSVLAAIDAGESGAGLPLPTAPDLPTEPRTTADGEIDLLFREVRKHLAAKAYDRVIDRLDIHRPAEWAVVNMLGMKTLRALGQAYLGLADLPQARDCLEQLRSAQKEQPLLPKTEYAAALTDLVRCYRGLGREDQARACQEEARLLL